MNSSKNILITGACGYLGSQLLQALREIEVPLKIRILDNFSTGSMKALINLPARHKYELLEGDILNPHILKVALSKIDIVIHLAAFVQTPMSFGDSQMIEQVNHWGTSHLLEAAVKAKIEHFIYTSSTSIYGPIRNKSSKNECRPFGLYSNSKYNAEKSLEAFTKRGLNTTVLRLGSIYGFAPITRFHAVVNKFIAMAGTKKPITVYGDGKQTRPIISIRDAADSILFCLKEKEKVNNKTFNVLEKNYSIEEITKILQKLDSSCQIRHIKQDIRTFYSFWTEEKLLQKENWKVQNNLKDTMGTSLRSFAGFQKLQLI